MTSPEIHFVISAPRSGSTWLIQALNQHPEIFATEQRLFGQFCEMWPNNNGKPAPRITLDAYARALSVHYQHDELNQSRAEFQENFIREYCRFVLDFAHKTSGKELIVDKITPYPGTTELVSQQIQHYFPESKIIKLIRDGRDVATSGTFDWLLKDGHNTDRFKCFVDRDPSVVVERFFDDQAIDKWAANWRQTVADLPHFALEVRFENMIADLSGVLLQIFRVLDLTDDPTIAERSAAAVAFEKMTGRKKRTDGTDRQTAKRYRWRLEKVLYRDRW